ncbi:hypothetical protein M6D93_05215 [Jatrophihabitans telluris]|uniref:Uncharacterized protein n=1 Tax=Jatrophihabitans telluris TaxID=2038343 RepID=A0ABY4R0U9_9ACTN|nr:hypothetical protein [Jatrophihabitans telluris]UQX89405.1 hypothetical protein M6D93_05215 [Jatrophihabitans telluris]
MSEPYEQRRDDANDSRENSRDDDRSGAAADPHPTIDFPGAAEEPPGRPDGDLDPEDDPTLGE